MKQELCAALLAIMSPVGSALNRRNVATVNRSFALILMAFCFGTNLAHAMEGVFDREADVQKYLLIIGSKSNTEVTNAAIEIYSSGISDDRLAKAVSDRLLNGYRDLKKQGPLPGAAPLPTGFSFIVPGVDDQYGMWMCRALSSFGNSAYASTLKQMKLSAKRGGVKSDRVRMVANSEFDRFEWHKRKNEIMASMQFHQLGDNEHVSRMLNLLAADDPTYRRFALDRIYRERIKDPRIYQALEDQISRHIDSRSSEPTRQENNLIAVNIKLLGLSGNARYRPILERVLQSNAVPGLKKHAQAALNRAQAVDAGAGPDEGSEDTDEEL